MITPLQAAQMIERTERNRRREPVDAMHEPYDGLESDIHQRILDYANSKGWAVVHSRMDKRSTIGIGCPDFILGADNSKTFWLECKRKGGKPTTEQLGRILMLRMLGHLAFIIYSYEEFLAVVNQKPEAK